jgi:quinol monooxygenase YgiN
MSAIALLVSHKTKPGCRDMMMQVWETHVKPRAEKNIGHLAYYFCFDACDEDRVTAFQVFESNNAKEDFLAGDWYPEYLAEVGKHIEEPPVISTARVVWAKQSASRHKE